MVKTSKKYAETIDSVVKVDVLSSVMSSLRITGSILLREDYAPPWAIAIPEAEKLRTILKLEEGVRVVDFHFVQRGHIVIVQENNKQTVVEAGEMVIYFGGKAHCLSDGECTKAIPLETILTGKSNPFQPSSELPARSASVMCGLFVMRDVKVNPLYSALPDVVHLSASAPSAFYNLSGVLARIALEINQKSLGSYYVVERLLELLCADSIRLHIESAQQTGPGWLIGLKDSVVVQAISQIHANPGQSWTIDLLAQSVAMSPSRFAARFSAAMGESPIAYVARWRMNVAVGLLDDTLEPVRKIAADVGYENVSAFNRAFKKYLGMPPAAWRARKGTKYLGGFAQPQID